MFRYGLAVAMTLIALAVRKGLDGWFPPGFPYLTFFPAVVVTAYFVGLRPAMLCAVLSGLAAWYFFIPPLNSFEINFATAVALIFYGFVVAVDIFFIDGMAVNVRQLEAERRRYAELAESRDLLYRELHHRVSNNIQVVGGLLRLQAARVNDDHARHALNEAGGRIEVIARIQRDLHNAVGAPSPFRVFARSLLENARQAAGATVTIDVDGGAAPLHSDQSTPVILFMLECFNNALEHGFAAAVEVSLKQDGDQHVLTIRDDGVGPPEGFDPTRSPSLGLRIARAMAGQLGGQFEMLRAEGWTVCRLTYPVKLDEGFSL